jgi:antitoxin component YwqK of YwqJK toxin-antitoxin module
MGSSRLEVVVLKKILRNGDAVSVTRSLEGMSEEILNENLVHDGNITLHEGNPFSGVCIDEWENGAKWYAKHYKDGIEHGLYASWYEDGGKFQEGYYKYGKQDGLWTLWYDSGGVESKGHRKDGIEHGLYTSWYEDGGKFQEGYYKYGKQDGLWTEWYDSGGIKDKGHYKDDRKEGLWIRCHENGKKLSERLFKDGNLITEDTFYANGIKKCTKHFKNEIENGLRTEWDENGKKTYEGNIIGSPLTVPKILKIWIRFFNRLTIEAFEALIELDPNEFSERFFGENNQLTRTELIVNFLETHKNLNEDQVLEYLNSLDTTTHLLLFVTFTRRERNEVYDILFSSFDDPNTKKVIEDSKSTIALSQDLYQVRYISKVFSRFYIDKKFNIDNTFDKLAICEDSFYWDRLNIRNTFKQGLHDYDGLSEYMKILGIILYNPDCGEDEEEDDFIDRLDMNKKQWLDGHELGNIESHMKRYFSLIPPFVSVENEIPEKVKELYAETRRCYVFGQFRAAVALSRSVIEVSLKDRLKVGTINQDWSAGNCLTTALQNKIINQELYIIGDDINVKANKILHAGADLSEEEALYFLDKAKTYIELFYK